MEQPTSRRLLGVAAIIIVGLLAELLPSGSPPNLIVVGDEWGFLPTMWDILATLMIFAVAGYISRTRFVPIATTIAVVFWMVAQYILYQIAFPAGQADILSIAKGNLLSLVIIAATAAVGAFLGEYTYSRRARTAPGAIQGN